MLIERYGLRNGVGASVALLLLFVAANIWATTYVLAEHYIYFWDWATYWTMFRDLGRLLNFDLLAAFTEVRISIATSDYNMLPVLPLMPFEVAFGPGRLSYILAITNVGILPSAALMAWFAQRTLDDRSCAHALLYAAAILCLHLLWAPALRGLPDVLGVVLACIILFVYFSDRPDLLGLKKLVAIGFLLCLLVLTRRYYLFWAASFFPAAILAYLLGAEKADPHKKNFLDLMKSMTIIAAVCGASLCALAAPLILRIATTNYSAAYAAYRSELTGASAVGQIVDQFGLSLLIISAGGLLWLAIRRDTRPVGIFLISQAVLTIALFTRVQTLMGVQHYYLLVPATGIGIAAALACLFQARLTLVWRAAGIMAILTAILVSSAMVFSSSTIANPLIPRTRYAPFVRSDMDKVKRLMATLSALKANHIYIAASSDTLNWSIMRNACNEPRADLCPHIETTADIDMRDGFPTPILIADYFVLATPTQYHVRPDDQQVVGLVARDIREGRGIGKSFRPLQIQFELRDGVKVMIYQKVSPIRQDAVEALSDELGRSYPQAKEFFQPPADWKAKI